jgi:microcystin-dependent protein
MESPCKDSKGCAGGFVCQEGTCSELCNSDAGCAESFLCESGTCRLDASPRIGAIYGNGSQLCAASGAERGLCFADGMVVEGHNLRSAEFRLDGNQTFSLTRVPAAEASDKRVTLGLPPELQPATYTLVASNQAGSDQTSVRVLQGEKGDTGPAGTYTAGTGIAIVGNTISADIGGNSGQVAAGDALAALQATVNSQAVTITNLETTLSSQATPPGAALLYAGTAAPAGWLVCNGAVLNVSTYPALFAAIGSTYGGNGVTTFALPDLRGRVPVGAGAGAGLTSRTLGTMLGAETHRLTTAEIPPHAHEQHAGDVAAGVYGGGGRYADGADGAATGINTSLAGGNSPHNNMQPSLVVNYIIKY